MPILSHQGGHPHKGNIPHAKQQVIPQKPADKTAATLSLSAIPNKPDISLLEQLKIARKLKKRTTLPASSRYGVFVMQNDSMHLPAHIRETMGLYPTLSRLDMRCILVAAEILEDAAEELLFEQLSEHLNAGGKPMLYARRFTDPVSESLPLLIEVEDVHRLGEWLESSAFCKDVEYAETYATPSPSVRYDMMVSRLKKSLKNHLHTSERQNTSLYVLDKSTYEAIPASLQECHSSYTAHIELLSPESQVNLDISALPLQAAWYTFLLYYKESLGMPTHWYGSILRKVGIESAPHYTLEHLSANMAAQQNLLARALAHSFKSETDTGNLALADSLRKLQTLSEIAVSSEKGYAVSYLDIYEHGWPIEYYLNALPTTDLLEMLYGTFRRYKDIEESIKNTIEEPSIQSLMLSALESKLISLYQQCSAIAPISEETFQNFTKLRQAASDAAPGPAFEGFRLWLSRHMAKNAKPKK